MIEARIGGHQILLAVADTGGCFSRHAISLA